MEGSPVDVVGRPRVPGLDESDSSVPGSAFPRLDESEGSVLVRKGQKKI